MEYLVVVFASIVSFGIGWFLSSKHRGEEERPLELGAQTPQSRILKPFAVKAKRKPRVNDDSAAYIREKNEN